MFKRVFCVVKVLSVALMFASLCVAEDASPASDQEAANANAHPRILRLAGSQSIHSLAYDEFEGLERTLRAYQSAFDNLSLSEMRQVWPALDHKRERAFQGVFRFLGKEAWTHRLDLACSDPTVSGTTAAVACTEMVTYGRADRKPQVAGPARIAIYLRRQNNTWIVESMKGIA